MRWVPACTVGVIALATLGGSVLGCALPVPAPSSESGAPLPPTGGGPVGIDLDEWAGRLRTTAVVVQGDTLQLLFDTGGGQTLFSPRVADALECVAPGYTVGMRMSGERVEWPTCGGATLRLGNSEFTDVRYGIWDVMSVLPEGLPSVDGVLSLDVLRGRPIVLDLSASVLSVETAESFRRRTADMREVPVRAATGSDGALLSIFVRVEIDGVGPAWLLVDSGNLDTVLVSERRGLVGDSVDLRIGGLNFRVASRSAPLIHDGALSEAVLSQLVLALDLGEMRGWVTRPGWSDAPRPVIFEAR